MSPPTYLYVPGDRPERFAKALASGSGAVVFDLEDAVSGADKERARTAVHDHLEARQPIEQWVRINEGDAGREDLRVLAGCTGLAGVFVPKATRAQLDALHEIAPVARCVLVETAAALVDLVPLASAPDVVALVMGEVDLVADLRINPSEDEHEMWPLRMHVVAASAAAGLRPPVGPVFLVLNDLVRLRTQTAALRRAGFESRQVIHPKQVTPVDEVLSVTADEVARAETLVREASSSRRGVLVDDQGRMVDEAVLRAARHTLSRARRE